MTDTSAYSGLAAKTYDLVYRAIDMPYEEQAGWLTAFADRELSFPWSVLDVACGTGHHLELLRKRGWDVHGVDLTPDMLAEAECRLGSGRVTQGDMRTFKLQPRFKVVTCWFGSIGHMLTFNDLNRAVANMVGHVAPGGWFICEPWAFLGDNIPEESRPITADGPDLVVNRTGRNATVDERVVTIRLHYEAHRPDSRHVQTYDETFQIARHSQGDYVTALESAGLTRVRHYFENRPDGTPIFTRGLFMGQRPS